MTGLDKYYSLVIDLDTRNSVLSVYLQEVLPRALATYKQLSGCDTKVTIDKDNFLSKEM